MLWCYQADDVYYVCDVHIDIVITRMRYMNKV